MSSLVPTAAELAEAYAETRRAARVTPLLDAPGLAERIGAAALWVKAENLQRAGSFKLRGAWWRLACLTDAEKARGVVAYSSGNFAQGLAAAGREMGVPVTIVMPADAPETKRRATEGYGARMVLSDHGDRPREEAASALAQKIAVDQGLVLLHPFDDPRIVAGQAGAALEAVEQLGSAPDVVLCPVGGGGLIGGVALAVRAANPAAEIWAVEPEGYDGMGRSLAARARQRVTGGTTLCDALQATMPGAAPFAAAQAAGVRGLSVSDTEIRRAMRVAFDELKLVLEPSGAVALAAVLAGKVAVAGKRVMVFATGGNVAFDRFAEILQAEQA
jgi:threonine dehydratase